MATKVHHLQAIPGTEALWRLLDLMSNKEQYAAYLAEMETARKSANETIEMIAPATEIGSLRAEAGRLHEVAAKALEDAELKAREILVNARVKAQAEDERIAQAQAELQRKKSEFEQTTSARMAELADQAAELTRLHENIQKEKAEAQSVLVEGKAMKVEYEQKLEKINRLSAELK